MDFLSRIKEESHKAYKAELEKKKGEFDRKIQFILEAEELDGIIANNVKYIARHFFSFLLFCKNYSIVKRKGDFFWELRGRFFQKRFMQ